MSDYSGNLAELYIQINAKVDSLQRQLENATKTAKQQATEIQNTFNNLKVGFDNHVMTLKISEVKTAYEQLKNELKQKIEMNSDMRSIEETRIKLSSVQSALRGVKDESEETKHGFAAIWANAQGQIRGAIGLIGEAAVGLFTLKKAFDFTKDSISVAAEFERLQTRLNSLYGSVEAGTRVFEKFKDVAQTTPYSLREVTEAGTSLKAFGMDAENTIKIAADLAAFMGVSMPEAASAMGRAFAGGAGAADIFRERGVLTLIKSFKGIDDITKLTLPEFRKAMLDTFIAPTAGIAGATDNLSKTFGGAMSNMGDAIDNVKNAIGQKFLPTLTMMVKGWTDVISSMVPADNVIEKVTEKGTRLKTRFEQLAFTIEDLGKKNGRTKEEQQLYQESLDAMMKEYPNYFKNFDIHKSKYDDIAAAITSARSELEKYTEAMIRNAIAQDKLNQIVELGKQKYEALKQVESVKAEMQRRTADGSYGREDAELKQDLVLSGNRTAKAPTYGQVLSDQLRIALKTMDEADAKIQNLQAEMNKLGGMVKLNPPINDTNATKNPGLTPEEKKRLEEIKKQEVDAAEKVNEAKAKLDEQRIEDEYQREKKSIDDKLKLSVDKAKDKLKFSTKENPVSNKAVNDEIKAAQIQHDADMEKLEREHAAKLRKEKVEEIQTNAKLAQDLAEAEGKTLAQAIMVKQKYLQDSLSLVKEGTEEYKKLVNELKSLQGDLEKALKSGMKKEAQDRNKAADPKRRERQEKQDYEFQIRQWREQNKLLADVTEGTIDSITSGWNSAMSNWISGTETFTQAATSAFENMKNQFLQMIEEMIVKYALFAIIKAATGGTGGFFEAASGFLGFGGTKAAKGADFIVPAGYPNDSYPMLVQSGERVTVTPAGQMRNNGGGMDIGPLISAMVEIRSSIQAMNVNLVQKNFSPVIVNKMDGKTFVRDVTRPAEQLLSKSGAKQI